MDTIRNYLDNLFASIPKTPETQRAKEDLLATMEDHYHELIEEEKSENEAIGAVISEFGSIDELLNELELEKETASESTTYNTIEIDESLDFWDSQRRFAFTLASGVFLFCLALAAVVFANYGSVITPLSIILFFVLIATGIALITNGSIKYSGVKKGLANRPLAKKTVEVATEQTQNYEKSFRIGLTLGIVFCTLAPPILLFFSELLGQTNIGVSAFFFSIGIGFFLLIYTSTIYNGFKKLKETDYFISDEDKSESRVTKENYGKRAPFIHFFRRIYWPCIVVLYFLFSNITDGWAYSWLIFVVAGPIFSLIMESCKNKEDEEP